MPDVSGEILFKRTSSPIFCKQQISRALTAGSTEVPLILDIVNNFDGLTSIGTSRMEMEDAVRRLRQTGQGSLIRVETFQIEEQVEALNAIGMVWDVFDARWEMHYRQAKEYFEAHGHLDIPRTYKMEDGFLLGPWVAAQRRSRTAKGKGKQLSQEQIDKLSAIGMAWDGTFDTQWQSAYAKAEEYYRQNGDLNIPYVYCTPDGYQLGKWLARQKSAKRAPGTHSNCVMTAERITKLESIGVVWETAEQRMYSNRASND